MWRFVIVLCFWWSGLTVASAQVFNTDYDYAIVEVISYSASLYTEKDRTDRNRKANEEHQRKHPGSTDRIIVASNSCGKGRVEFAVTQASTKTKKSLKMNYSLGEWCTQRYQLHDTFLAVLKKGSMSEDVLFPLIEHHDDGWVLHIDPEELLELQSRGFFPLALEYKTYDPPLEDIRSFKYDIENPYHLEMAQHRSDLDILIEDGEEYIVVTRAIPVTSLISKRPE